MYFLFRGKKLENESTIESCRITDGDTVLLVKRMNSQNSMCLRFCINV